MFKYIAFFFAVLAVAFAAPQPGYAPVAYSAGYVAPAAYSAYGGHYAAPVAAAYSAPVAYSGYSAYNPAAYSSYVY